MSWVRENLYAIILLAAFVCQTRVVYGWLESIALELFNRKLFEPDVINLSANVLLTYKVAKQRKPNLTFYSWLCCMLIKYNYLTFYPRTLFKIWGWTLPLFSIWQLAGIVLGCYIVADNSLIPGRRRQPAVPFRIAQRPIDLVEEREVKPVWLVSSPAFGPPWLSQRLQQYQAWLGRRCLQAAGILSRLTGIELGKKHGDLRPDLSLCIILLQATCFIPKVRELVTDFSEHHALIFVVLYAVLDWIQAATNVGNDVTRIWNLQDVMFHQALEVDGVYYELTRSGWFANSIRLTVKPVSNDREILSRRLQGHTFFTPEEIKETAQELIDVSPGYDAISFNCQAMRYNLFRRIMDDRGTSYGTRRLGGSYENVYACAAQSVFWCAYITFAIASSANDAGTGPISSALMSVFGAVSLVTQIRAIVFWSSTVYGRMYRNRIALPPIFGLVLLLRTVLLHNPGLGEFHTYIPVNSAATRMFWLLTWITIGLALADLSRNLIGLFLPAWEKQDWLHDQRFEVLDDTVIDCSDPDALLREAPGVWVKDVSTGKLKTREVLVKIRSVCGRPLEGELTRMDLGSFWPESDSEVLILVLAATLNVVSLLAT